MRAAKMAIGPWGAEPAKEAVRRIKGRVRQEPTVFNKEYVTGELGQHRAFLDRALPRFQADARLVGLAAGGSFITGELDAYSDLDLVVVSLPEASHDVLRERFDRRRIRRMQSAGGRPARPRIWRPLKWVL
jgi:UTP:GlnB (protein PII) uridylyltransferase